MTHPSARGSALDLLEAVMGDGKLLSELSPRLSRLPEADRARAMRLATQTLRGMERADRLLARSLRKKPPHRVKNILRLGTVELCMGGDAHGVVGDLVQLTGQNPRHVPMKGLVNAVLRGIADGGGAPWNDLRIPQLPQELRQPLVEAWGKGAVNGMEKAHFSGAALDITVKERAEDWAQTLGGRILPTRTVRIDANVQVSALPGFEEGAWWVQDAAAAIAAKAMAPKPGERVLDLCAAPGGKTMQLAQMGADVVAVDSSETRMHRLHENLSRTKLTAELRVADACDIDDGPYDAILLDAPCSATGTIRRHPDLPFAKRQATFAPLIDLQERLLAHAVGLLAPKGRLLYCTCSLLPEEGEQQIKTVLERMPHLTTCAEAFDLPGIDPAWITCEGGLRLRPDFWPDLGGMDGFYMACLRQS